MSSIDEYQLLERLARNLVDRPISENDKIDILDAYMAFLDAYNKYSACCRALETCGLPKEDPEYKKLKDAREESARAHDIAWDNYFDIYNRLFR